MRAFVFTITALLLAGHLAFAEPPVTVRVEEKTYPVIAHRERRGQAPTTKLAGKEKYATPALILENDYLRITILPEFGGRITAAIFKPTGREIFWQNDVLDNNCSWSMGGGRWSFPFHEHGRHLDETAGYVVRTGEDGSATIAMDMRFDSFMKEPELGRYGRATNLRLTQSVTLRPGRASFTWTGRVDNPLPIPAGFKLWYLLRYPNVAGTEIVLPTPATTGHGAGTLDPWPTWDGKDHTVTGDWQDSRFSIGIRHDFAGWYYPKSDTTHLHLAPREIAPGAKVVVYKPRPDSNGYYESWGGNHRVFEETGHLLPPYCSYAIPVEIFLTEGIGKATFANEHAVVATNKQADGAFQVGIFPLYEMKGATLDTGTKGGLRPTFDASPAKPHVFRMHAAEGEKWNLKLTSADGKVLLQFAYPEEPGPMPVETFKAVQDRVKGTFAGGKGLFAEANPLPTEHWLTLPKYRPEMLKTVEESEDVTELRSAARRLLHLGGTADAVTKACEKILAKQPDDPHANLYKAMVLLETKREKDALPLLKQAAGLPGGAYLLALDCVRRGENALAIELVNKLMQMDLARASLDRGDPAAEQIAPSTHPSPQRAMLLLASLQIRQGEIEAPRAILRKIVEQDPACIEAWALLARIDPRDIRAAAALRTLYDRNEAARSAVRANLAELETGVWRGIHRP